MADDKKREQIDLEKATKIVEETCDPEILEDDDSLSEDEKYIRESAWLLLQELAEEEDHHPAILLEWGRVEVTWWTHKIGGLHKNDFIAAAKTDLLNT